MVVSDSINSGSLFDPRTKIRCSVGFVLIVVVLLSLFSHHFYGQRRIDLMLQVSIYELLSYDYQHPIKDYSPMLLSSQAIPFSLMTNMAFNVTVGLAVKIAKLFLLFYIFRVLVKNDCVIFLILSLLVLVVRGFNPEYFFLSVNTVTTYEFRDIAGMLVLLSLLLSLRQQWTWTGVVCGLLFLVHPKMAVRWESVLFPTFLVWTWIKSRNLKDCIIATAQFLGFFLIAALLYIAFSFMRTYAGSSNTHFPFLAHILKNDPSLLITWFNTFDTYKFKKYVMMLCAGIVNVGLYHFWIKEYLDDSNKKIFSHPLTIFSIVAYAVFGFAVVFECLLARLPDHIVAALSLLRLWSLFQIFPWIFIILTLLFMLITLSKFERAMGIRISIVTFKTVLIVILVVAAMLPLFLCRDRGNTIRGLGMYRALCAPVPFDRFDYYAKEQAWAFEEQTPRAVLLSEQRLKDIESRFHEINWEIVQGNIVHAQKLFQKLTSAIVDVDDEYIQRLRVNTMANIEAAQGKLWKAYHHYRSVSDGAHIPFLSLEALAKPGRLVRTIPHEPYREAMLWIATNMPKRAAFINAPHIDNFFSLSQRESFFMPGYHSGFISVANAAYARIYLERLHDVLGLTAFDKIGISMLSYLDIPMVRYAFLDLKEDDFKRIYKKYPSYEYIFTEKSHSLPFPEVYKNEYFIIYKIPDT